MCLPCGVVDSTLRDINIPTIKLYPFWGQVICGAIGFYIEQNGEFCAWLIISARWLGFPGCFFIFLTRKETAFSDNLFVSTPNVMLVERSLSDVEQFLSMLRFENRSKLEELISIQ